MQRGRSSEHDEQTALLRWAGRLAATHPELESLFSVPNGGHRHPATAAKLKAEGVKRGVPDLCLPVARGGYHGLFIELKAQGGRLTPEQKEWLERLNAQGYLAVMCVGWGQAREILENYVGIKG